MTSTHHATAGSRSIRLVLIGIVSTIALLLHGNGEAAAGTRARPREEAITDAYETLLGRAPTGAELGFWSRYMDSGAGRLELTVPLARGGTTARTVERLYHGALGRAPQPDELEYWVRRAQSGTGLAGVAVGILGSAEARGRTGDDAEYVALLYRNVLGREPSPADVAYWTGIDAWGDARIVAALWGSAEGRQVRIRSAYLSVLGREPDPGGIAHWADTGVDEPLLSAHLAATDEFWRPSVPSELPFHFAGGVLQTAAPLGTEGVLFVVSFASRLPGDEFCRRVVEGLLRGGAELAVGCSPERPFFLGSYNDELLMVAATDLRTFTVTIGSRH